MTQIGFFDLWDRYASLDAKKDPLVEIDAIVPWEAFRSALERVLRTYSLKGIQQYDDLRSKTLATPRILVVLYLPWEKKRWLKHTDDALLLSKCAL